MGTVARRLGLAAVVAAVFAVPDAVLAATPPGTYDGGDDVIDVSPLGRLIELVAPLVGIAIVLGIVIGLGALVARIGGPPEADGAADRRWGLPRSVAGRVALAVIAVYGLSSGFILGWSFITERSAGGLGGAIGAAFAVLGLIAELVLLVGVGLVATAIRRGHLTGAIRTLLFAGALVGAGAAGGVAYAAVMGDGGQAAAVALEPAGTTSAELRPTPNLGASDVAAPAVLVVACDGTRTDVAIPRVRARLDGVHLRFTNSSGGDLSFSIDESGGLPLLGDSVPAAGGEAVETIAVGDYLVSCGGESVAFTIVDPDHAYVPAQLTCPGNGGGSGTSGVADYPLGATGPHGSPVDVARLELRGLQPGDVVEPAGYPRGVGEQLVRVVRDGQVIVVLAYLADGSGGWLLSGTSSCAGSDITAEQPD